MTTRRLAPLLAQLLSVALLATAAIAASACGDDDDGRIEADRKGVGAECVTDDQCLQQGDCDAGPCIRQTCLTDFKGGYCGVRACAADADCPTGSACVVHSDGTNYCFRQCVDKPECNANRSADNEANCSSSVDYVDSATTGKACVPPSGS